MKKIRISLPDGRCFYPTKLLIFMKLTTFLLLINFSCIAATGYSQSEKVSIQLKDATMKDFFSMIESQTDYKFLYRDDAVENIKINLDESDMPLDIILNQLLVGSEFEYKILANNLIAIAPAEVFQQTKLTGTVSDADGSPLTGVTVVIEGSNTGSITDINGKYTIETTTTEGTLTFSYIGYNTTEIAIDGRSIIDVIMELDVKSLEEVIVIGYGTVKKSDLTGSVSSVTSKDLVSFPSLGINQAVQGRATGIQVTSLNGDPGGGTRIRIRGGTSLNASSDPLYVIDGFAGGAIPPPEDIKSIEILKDASATAIYGSRGANGVVLITTKSGKTGDTKIEFNSSYSYNKLGKKLDLLNATEFAEYINEVRANSGSTVVPFPNPSSYGVGTDWQDIIFKDGSLQNYQLSASGGKESFRFYTSLNYYGQDGIVINSDYKRYSGLTNLDIDAGKNLKIGTRMFFRRSIENGIKSQEGSGGATNTGVISGALIISPTIGIYNDDGSFATSPIGDPYDNPYATATQYVNESVNDLYQGSTYVDLTIMEGLVFKSTLGVSIRNNRNGSYYPTTLNAGRNVGGDAGIGASKSTSVLNENYLSYNKAINNVHKINLLAGHSYQSSRYEGWSSNNNSYITDSYLFWNLDGGADYQLDYSNLSEWELLSYYGRANYNFNDKYLFTFTGRFDGSSRLGKNNKWGFFPSSAFAWNIKQEPFLESFETLSQLKLRASYGVTGNTDIGVYQSLANFASGVASINEATVNAVVPSSVANSDLAWESTKQTDIGLDIGFWNGRLNANLDYYYKKTEDLLYRVPLPQYSGYSTSFRNIGSLENKGFEVGINTVNVENSDLSWTSDFNISFSRNKILSLPSGELIYKRRPGHIVGDDTHILTEGSPAGSFYGYIYDGVNEADGSPIYRDIAGRDTDNKLIMQPDGVVNSDDRTIIGNPHPDYILGLNNTLQYKNFDLNVFFQGVVGNDMMNFTRMELEWVSGKGNQMATVLNRWAPTNTQTDIPVAASYSSITSTRWVEDGTYVRLKNVSLGYNIPERILLKAGIEKLRVYVGGQNLWTITKYTGYNPDVSYNDGNTSLGLDYGSYPSSRSITFGLNVTF
jgi:TonB-dependent starch-binding outer membrane protein SusC